MNAPETQDMSQGDAAYAKLHQAIEDGVFVPGDRLRETDVAQRLSLSRTPVREALRKLEADGIVEHRPRIGAVIRTLDHTEVVELYEMRIVLERTAAEMAAKHCVGICARLEQCVDVAGAYDISRCGPDQDRRAATSRYYRRDPRR